MSEGTFQGEFEEEKIFGAYWGVVTRNDDPEKRGRVRVRIPGLLEPESPWAEPIGMLASGLAQRGGYFVPEVGSTVAVFFMGGDVEAPAYMAGPPGAPEGETDIPSTPKTKSSEEAPFVRAFETETFEFFISDLPDDRRIVFRNKANGDFIEMNALENSMTLQASTSLIVNCDGIVQLGSPDPTKRPAVIQVNGRRVLTNGGPI